MDTTTTVRSLGGNQYEVTIGEETRTIDLDGYTVISDTDWNRIDDAGLDDDTFISPHHDDGDEFWAAAANEAANYSGFDVDAFIEENKE